MELTNIYSPQYLKLREAEAKKKTVFFRTSRSVNPEYKEIYKLHDVTRYNAATHNVAHYKDFPNRAGTPIRPSLSPKRSVERQRAQSPKYNLIRSMIGGKEPLREEIRKGLIETAMETPIRVTTAGPTIARHHTGRVGGVINDYHSRETNPGFSRNDFGGGFFTR
mmetsp:Transcript_29118/g.52095  ORF Transcript_29118/g.52095 Transcript_29118/m.52095 type:complete len:165 (+) Transcript_29118:2907-3401(+)